MVTLVARWWLLLAVASLVTACNWVFQVEASGGADAGPGADGGGDGPGGDAPAGAADAAGAAVCGDGAVTGPELCDPQSAASPCPTACASPACAPTELVDASTCQARCAPLPPITTCQSGDDCCLPMCAGNGDSDCPTSCDNGVLDPGELCDGDCPTPDTCLARNTGCETWLFVDDGPCRYQCLLVDEDLVCSPQSNLCCPLNCNAGNDADC